MSEITSHLRTVLVRELRAFAREIEMFPDDDSVWKTLPGVTNSAGNLALHCCGGLQHLVGRVLGGTGYVRDRDLEFSRRSGTRVEILAEIQRTIDVVEAVVPRLAEETLSREYPEALGGSRLRTDLFLVHLGTHLAHHLGQAGYLRRVLTADNRSSGPIALKDLVGSTT